MPNAIDDYRKQLASGALKSIEAFDKTLVSLASGALAISLVFVHDIVGDKPIAARGTIVAAWVCWVVSLGLTLSSFYTSYLGHSKAIDQVDREAIVREKPGGFWSRLTGVFTPLSAAVFLFGVFFMVWFAASNLR